MNEKILNETSDYLNFKYPGMTFLDTKIFQSSLPSLFVPVKNKGNNPRQNFKILFEKDAEILKSQALVNKKNQGNMLNLAKDLVELFQFQEEMLVNNEKIIKAEKKFTKELSSYSVEVKLIVEVFKANLSLDSKMLYRKMVQKELHEINGKVRKLQENYHGLKTFEIDSFFNIQEYIRSVDLPKVFEGFNYQNGYQTCVNFFEMNSINLNHVMQEAKNSSGKKNDETQTTALFFEVQKIILESQKFYLNMENILYACVVYAYNKLMTVLKKYMEELKNLEKLCLEINQNVLCIIYLEFLKKKFNEEATPLVKDLENFRKESGVLPLYENMDLQKTNHKLKLADKFLANLKNNKTLIIDVKNHFQYPYFRVFFNQLYFDTLKKFKNVKIQIKKTCFCIRQFDAVKIQEIKFNDVVVEAENFIKHASALSNNDRKQESTPPNYPELFLESNEHLTTLNSVFSALKKFSEFPEFKSLINPLQMKINYYLEALNAINDRFIIYLQKGSEENDQSCLEYIAESERLINDSYYLINNSFNEKIMKAIERSHVENEGIFRESKRILNLLIELRNVLENICKEEYICSLVLKKNLENKYQSVKVLITNIEGLLLSISNCNFFNISQINGIMQNNLQMRMVESQREVKKNDKMKRIVNHIKDVNDFLEKNQKEMLEKVTKSIMERANIEVKFYNFFLFMDETNQKSLYIFEDFQLTEFSIILFDKAFLEKISEVCQIYTEMETNSQQILTFNQENHAVVQKIMENLKMWRNNIQKHLFFDENSIHMLKNKLEVISHLENDENEILREINGIFALCEKTPRKKKNNTNEKAGYVEKFFNETNSFCELASEAQIAKNYIFGYRQRGNINKIIHLEQLKELISEITDLNRILTISVKYIKEISEEENEMALRDNVNCAIDEGFITENDVVDENNDENLIKLKFKEYLKERLQKFQNETDTDKPKQKDLSIKLKKFLQNSLYV